MLQSSSENNELPDNPRPLGLELSFPAHCLAALQRGYEAQSQDDKWSVYYRKPWVQIWRPNFQGWYCYAVRLEESDSHRIHVTESWAGSQILDPQRGLGPELERHQEIVTWMLGSVAGFSGERFEHGNFNGTRQRKTVTFSGVVSSLEDVDMIAEKLRAEVTHMLKEGW